jgi:hypothetical protein
MKRVGYVLMLLFGCLVIGASLDQWQKREFVDSISFFAIGMTFVVVFGDLLLVGRVRKLGKLLGALTVGPTQDDGEDDEQQRNSSI